MGIKSNETLLVVTDDILKKIGYEFFYAASSISKETILLNLQTMQEHGQEPPQNVSQYILSFDVALLITSKSLSHTKARKKASDKGVRIASMPGITLEIINRSLDVDYVSMREKMVVFSKIFKQARRIHLTTDAGTDLKMDIEDRDLFIDDGCPIDIINSFC